MTTLAAARDRLVAALPRSIDFLDRLLAIDTSLPPGRGYPALADCVAAEVEPLGFACRRVVVPEALWRNEAFGFTQEPVVLVYLNRLSDLLFVMARAANHRAGVPEQIW